jgi:hypothetical protein
MSVRKRRDGLCYGVHRQDLTLQEKGRSRVACRFPDADVNGWVGYLSENGAFEVVSEGRFYSTRSLHQHADSRIDDTDRLLIDTDETRVTIDP